MGSSGAIFWVDIGFYVGILYLGPYCSPFLEFILFGLPEIVTVAPDISGLPLWILGGTKLIIQ